MVIHQFSCIFSSKCGDIGKGSLARIEMCNDVETGEPMYLSDRVSVIFGCLAAMTGTTRFGFSIWI